MKYNMLKYNSYKLKIMPHHVVYSCVSRLSLQVKFLEVFRHVFCMTCFCLKYLDAFFVRRIFCVVRGVHFLRL